MKMFFVLFFLCFACAPEKRASSYLPPLHKDQNSQEENIAHHIDAVRRGEQTLDRTLVRHFAKGIIRESVQNPESIEEELLAVFAAAYAEDEELLPLIESALSSRSFIVQLAAIQVLGKLHHDRAKELIFAQLNHPIPEIRLEAAYIMAIEHFDAAADQIASLEEKLFPDFRDAFASLYAQEGSESSQIKLRRLFFDEREPVRIAAIIAVGKHQLHSLSDEIERTLSSKSPAELEAAIWAAAELKSIAFLPLIEAHLHSNSSNVALAADRACHLFDERHEEAVIDTRARDGDIFAIALTHNEELLKGLLASPDERVRANASIALIRLGSDDAYTSFLELLLNDASDKAVLPSPSPGLTITAYKLVPSASLQLSKDPISFEIALSTRHELFEIAAQNLSKESFTALSRALFVARERKLLPQALEHLSQMNTPTADRIIEEASLTLGNPLLRAWALLSLYSQKERKELEKELVAWVKAHAKTELIRFRTPIPVTANPLDHFQLQPLETSQLLLESFLVLSRTENGLLLLIDILETGNPQNRPAIGAIVLKGLL